MISSKLLNTLEQTPNTGYLSSGKLSTMTEAERREFKRLRLPFKGVATFSSHGKMEVEARDISAGSAYLIVDTCLSIKEQVNLFMRWPHEREQPGIRLNADGEVHRVEQLSEKVWGCVVKFEVTPEMVWEAQGS
jgi:hypothetical protein